MDHLEILSSEFACPVQSGCLCSYHWIFHSVTQNAAHYVLWFC